ncbi:MAG: hypothetical protein IJF17_12635 [Thermoguttaceae bacterium]|nr:hypothetical protein [Thermoguttaceae bacterium]
MKQDSSKILIKSQENADDGPESFAKGVKTAGGTRLWTGLALGQCFLF